MSAALSLLPVITTKVCTKCGIEKPTSEYHRNKSKKDGLTVWCKNCCHEHHVKYYDLHRESGKDYTKKWRQINYEHAIRNSKIYRQNNGIELRERRQIYRLTQNGYVAIKWGNLNSRCINGSHPNWNDKHARRYLLAGVELRITRQQFYDFVGENWAVVEVIRSAGGVPSIDRIGPSIHYQLGNIQIIPLSENCRKAGKKSSHPKRRVVTQPLCKPIM